MVFDNQGASGDANGVTQQHHGIICVVQHIDKKHHVEAFVGVRERLAIKQPHRNVRRWPGEHIHSFQGEIRTALGKQLRKQTIAGADVQDRGLFGYERGEMTA